MKVIREDPGNRDLLFAGTEFGLFVSFDAGAHWMRWKDGLPTVAVDDILVHPRERDLIVATHGRSLYVLDGIQLLEEWTPAALVGLGDVRDTANRVGLLAPHARRQVGPARLLAKNPPFGAWFDYFLPRELEDGVSIAVTDSAGHAVRTLEGPGEPGFHRVTWDLQAGDPKNADRRRRGGGPALPT